MSSRIRVLFCLLIAVLLITGLARAQQAKKVPRIGYLSPLNPASESSRSQAIRLALRELGYIEGQNIATEYRYAEGKANRYPELAAELVRLKVGSSSLGIPILASVLCRGPELACPWH